MRFFSSSPTAGTASLDGWAARPPLLLHAPDEDHGIGGGGEKFGGIEVSFAERVVARLHEGTPRGVTGVDAAIGGIRVRPVEGGLRSDVLVQLRCPGLQTAE